MPAQRRENHQKIVDSSLEAVRLENVPSDDGNQRMRQVYDMIPRAYSSDVDETGGSHEEVGNVRRPRGMVDQPPPGPTSEGLEI